MIKIPVKIIQVTSPSGDTKKGVMLDSSYYFEMNEDARAKIKEFEKLYFETVKIADQIFFGSDKLKKKYQNLPSSVYWKLAEQLYEFDKKVDSTFDITNYAKAIGRDFGISSDYVSDLLSIVKYFKKREILDSVPFSYYRALKRKRKELESLGLFEKEKKRLNKMGKNETLPGREKYKIELIKIIEKSK